MTIDEAVAAAEEDKKRKREATEGRENPENTVESEGFRGTGGRESRRAGGRRKERKNQ